MNDRELLKLAAKAAGITLVPYTWSKGTGWDHEGFTVAGKGDYEWNPLESDGAALRLGVGLLLTVVVRHHECEVFSDDGQCLASEPIFTASAFIDPEQATDPQAATRRAIVRAAAEVGKAQAA